MQKKRAESILKTLASVMRSVRFCVFFELCKRNRLALLLPGDELLQAELSAKLSAGVFRVVAYLSKFGCSPDSDIGSPPA